MRYRSRTSIRMAGAGTAKTCQYQMPVKVWRNWNSHILLMRVQNVTPTLENSLVVPYKGKIT